MISRDAYRPGSYSHSRRCRDSQQSARLSERYEPREIGYSSLVIGHRLPTPLSIGQRGRPIDPHYEHYQRPTRAGRSNGRERLMPELVPRWRPPRLRVKRTKEQAHYQTAAWRLIRAAVLVRDACVCRSCDRITTGKAAHIDHILPLELGGSDALANLQTLCSKCHGKKTVGEQRARGWIGGGVK